MSQVQLNQTHDPALRSWVESANDPAGDFPIQNLPFGVFRRSGADEEPRIGVAIGDQILDLRETVNRKAIVGMTPESACALCASTLNQFMALGRLHWIAARKAISEFLDKKNEKGAKPQAALVAMKDAQMLLPAAIGDYTDFYASLHHATNVGSMFRPDQPLMPNWKHLPVGYHGRGSSIVVSGTPVRRPMGQIKADDTPMPTFGPTRMLDYELEVGFFVGPGNPVGARIQMAEAADHIFGLVLVNDWSARDVQKWEYQPLGPFNAKNFATTISPWVVTMEALQPFRVDGPPRGTDDPPVLDYLRPAEAMGLNISLEACLASGKMRKSGSKPILVSRSGFGGLYWTVAQMLVHHTSTGCNLRPGDLIASGTVSGPTEDSRGCLLERTWKGTKPLHLPDGSDRSFLVDGDQVIFRGAAERNGFTRMGFGECEGVIEPAQ